MSPRTVPEPDRFQFRGLHPALRFGTASDRYAGWMGQIYSEERYAGRITGRAKKIGSRSFREEVLPVESVSEYFDHFDVLEIDYTFYQTLLDESGSPMQSYRVLKHYQAHMLPEDGLMLKVPQAITAQKVWRDRHYGANEQYLNSRIFTQLFYQPAQELLGSQLKGFIFEQEYQRKNDRIAPEVMAEALDGFFSAIPDDTRYHLELRTEAYLADPVFRILERHGVGQVLSHWTWLPSLSIQWARAQQRLFNADRQMVIRLMTPLGIRYEDAYARAYPFNRIVDGLLQPRMVSETVRLLDRGIRENGKVNLIVNNRAGGNAPLIIQQIARQFLNRTTQED